MSLSLQYRSRTASSPPAPAVVLLHGRGADETDLLSLATHLPESVHVFSVRGPLTVGDGYGWYHSTDHGGGVHATQPSEESLSASISALTDLFDHLESHYRIETGRIALVGFSQGGTLALATAVTAPSQVSCVAAMSAYLPETHQSPKTLLPARSVPVLLTAGEQDLAVPPSRTEHANTRLSDVGLDVTYRAYPTNHGVTDQERTDVAQWLGRHI